MIKHIMNKNRLRWASRRGMLELDLILAPFVENVYDTLDQDDKLRFEVLLECEQPADVNMQRILQIIRESRQKS